MSSESGRRKNEEKSCHFLTRNPVMGGMHLQKCNEWRLVFTGPILHTGNFYHFWCKYWYNNDRRLHLRSMTTFMQSFLLIHCILSLNQNVKKNIGMIGQSGADIPILGVAVGALMTLVVQSSSATIAVLQNFAAQPGS